MPELKMGNVRIKQHYKPSSAGIDYFFPEKWGISAQITRKPLESMVLF